MIPPSPPPPVRRQIRLWDLVASVSVIIVLGLAVLNVLANMQAAGMRPGFGFLWQSAGFDVNEALIPYSSEQAYARVILIGVLNTMLLAAVCLVLATLVGLVIGLIGVGPSPIGRAVAIGYVELFRNLPKLLILLIIYVVAVNGLPHVRQAMEIGPFLISNRSLYFPTLVWDARQVFVLVALAVGALIARTIWRQTRPIRSRSRRATWLLIVSVALGLPCLTAWALSVPFAWSAPELAGFDFQGGARVSLQFAVIALTLALYHGAQIGEVVRGGIQAVPAGQWEAAKALGLPRSLTLRFIILPQVVRVIIPSMNNQYVNLIKNTSIGIAVGYSELMSISGTIINQSFRPLEMMLITMAIYLAICLLVTSWLNRISDRLRARERA